MNPIDCLGASAATRRCVPITAQCDDRPRGYIRDAIYRELTVNASANGCVVKCSAQSADLEVAGDAERAHIWVGCGSNRQMSVRPKRRGNGSVGNSAAGLGRQRRAWCHRRGRSAAASSNKARSPTRARRQYWQLKKGKNLFLTQVFNSDADGSSRHSTMSSPTTAIATTVASSPLLNGSPSTSLSHAHSHDVTHIPTGNGVSTGNGDSRGGGGGAWMTLCPVSPAAKTRDLG